MGFRAKFNSPVSSGVEHIWGSYFLCPETLEKLIFFADLDFWPFNEWLKCRWSESHWQSHCLIYHLTLLQFVCWCPLWIIATENHDAITSVHKWQDEFFMSGISSSRVLRLGKLQKLDPLVPYPRVWRVLKISLLHPCFIHGQPRNFHQDLSITFS